jgi:hypothetical protein
MVRAISSPALISSPCLPPDPLACLYASAALKSVAPLFSYFAPIREGYELLFPPARRPLGGQALCFDDHPHCPGVSPPASFRLCVSVSLWQIPSFHAIAGSLLSRKKSSALESATSGLFCKNTGGGGYLFTIKLVPDHVLHGVPNSRDSQRAALFAESPAFAAFQVQNHYLPEAALC